MHVFLCMKGENMNVLGAGQKRSLSDMTVKTSPLHKIGNEISTPQSKKVNKAIGSRKLKISALKTLSSDRDALPKSALDVIKRRYDRSKSVLSAIKDEQKQDKLKAGKTFLGGIEATEGEGISNEEARARLSKFLPPE